MKLISWNVNGLRACVGKNFMEDFKKLDADIFCLQETKLQEGQIALDLPDYHQYWNYAEKKGYSGTAVFTRKEPLSVAYGIGVEEHDHEGRVITLEFEDYYLVTVYTPNSQDGLKRLDYRMQWEDDFLAYIKSLDEKKPVIYCGDLNVAHQEIDLKNPKTNRKNAGGRFYRKLLGCSGLHRLHGLLHRLCHCCRLCRDRLYRLRDCSGRSRKKRCLSHGNRCFCRQPLDRSVMYNHAYRLQLIALFL